MVQARRTWPFEHGELAGLIRGFDWPSTPLGPVEAWPQSLKTAVDLLLPSGFPMIALWGADLIQVYNDAYGRVMGDKHPRGLGQPTRECWPEVWHINGPIYERVWAGETVTYEDGLYPLSRHGAALEDAWFSLTYSPLRAEDGAIAGVLVTLVETTERVRTEAALRRSEMRLRAFVTAGGQPIYRMSADWRELYELEGQSFLVDTVQPVESWAERYILEEDRPALFAAIQRAIRDRAPFELEHRVRTADGGVGWVLSRAVPMLGPDGEIVEWFGAGLDITERRRAVDKLREAEDRHRAELERQVVEATFELKASHDLLQATMDASTDMIQVFAAVRDEAGRIVDFKWVLNNHTSEARYGEVQGESLLQRNPGVVEEGIFAAFARVTETGVPEAAERHYAHEQFDGWFLQSVVKLGDGVATTTKDITEWKAAQAEVLRLVEEVAQSKLRMSEERFRGLVEGHAQAVWEADPRGMVASGSPSWSAYTGQNLEDRLCEGWLEAVHPDDRDDTRRLWRAAVAERRPLSAEFRLRHAASGGHRWTNLRAVPLLGRDGEVAKWVGMNIDVHDRWRAEERQAILLAELQHRVRNILALVRSIVRRSGETEDDSEVLEAHLLGRIDALARTQAMLTRAAGARVDLENLLREELLAQVAPEDRIRLKGPPTLLAPKAAEILTLALHELATNANKFGALTAPAGRIAIAWETEPREGETWLTLEWREMGVPMLAASPRPTGFGTELITRRVPYELEGRGELVLRPGGVVARIAFPLRDEASILQTDSPIGDPEEPT